MVVRRHLHAAIASFNQELFLRAQVGVKELYRPCGAMFMCNTPYGTLAGSDLQMKGGLKKAQQLLSESGYDGTPVVVLKPTDLLSIHKLPDVAAQLLRQAGFKVEVLAMDWQSVVARRAKKDAPDKGGWNVFYTTTVTVDADNPAGNSFTSGGCDKAWFGWPCDPEIEKLRASFARESDPEKRKQIALAVSDRVMDQASYIVLGQYKAFGAYRKDRISGWLAGPVPVWWNITKK